jgi:hypothetical protein
MFLSIIDSKYTMFSISVLGYLFCLAPIPLVVLVIYSKYIPYLQNFNTRDHRYAHYLY